MLASWAVLTLVVGLDAIFLGEEGTVSTFDAGGAPGGCVSIFVSLSKWSVPKTLFVFALHKNLAKLVTKRINSR